MFLSFRQLSNLVRLRSSAKRSYLSTYFCCPRRSGSLTTAQFTINNSAWETQEQAEPIAECHCDHMHCTGSASIPHRADLHHVHRCQTRRDTHYAPQQRTSCIRLVFQFLRLILKFWNTTQRKSEKKVRRIKPSCFWVQL